MENKTEIPKILERLRTQPGITIREPASDDACDVLEEYFEVDLTPELREFYQQCNGITSSCLDGFVKSLDELVTEMSGDFQENMDWPVAKRFGLLPVIDLWDGNWWCVSQLEPMRGRVLYFSHDDPPGLQFRSFTEALSAWASMAVTRDYETQRAIEQRGSYRESLIRSEKDRSDGKAMSTIASEFPGKGYPALFQREAVIGMGLDLLSVDDLDLMVNLLDTEYSMVAYRHLKNLNHSPAVQIADNWMDNRKK